MEWTWDEGKAEANDAKHRVQLAGSVVRLEREAGTEYRPAMNPAQALVETIAALPPARLAEVTQFVAFVAAREREAVLTRDAAAVSAPSFADVWDNDDDAVYDGL